MLSIVIECAVFRTKVMRIFVVECRICFSPHIIWVNYLN